MSIFCNIAQSTSATNAKSNWDTIPEVQDWT